MLSPLSGSGSFEVRSGSLRCGVTLSESELHCSGIYRAQAHVSGRLPWPRSDPIRYRTR